MQVKKFEATDMSEALELVKRQLGSDAVILSTRRIRKAGGAFGILGRQVVEVTAATDREYASHNQVNGTEKRKDNFEKNILFNPLNDDIQEMKGMLRSLIRNSLPQDVYDLPEGLLYLYRNMVQNGVVSELASEIIREVKETLSQNDVKRDGRVKECLSEILERIVMVSGPLQVEDGRQKVVAFVGPTGVGKTTTIAKIAAKQALEAKKRTALITLDTYRIAAIEQLRTYARIIGIPVEVLLHGSEIQRVLQLHQDKDLILIDTAGRNHRSQSQISELSSLFDTTIPIETHLVLSATTKDEDIDDICSGYNIIPIHRLLFTKLDESLCFGSIINQAVRSGIQLSYFTTGQRVPEDIEVATHWRILDLILK
ncbi:MAG: flagellar biosynthesis protein FlhF [Thermodesulfobacteriota bacterium]|nr:flagellar biosynthesis protein FlhF [Thermodesulfobacteriota bacterium]